MSDATFPLWPGKFVNPKFRQYQSKRNNKKFNCCLGIQSEMAVRICIYTLNPLKLPANQILMSIFRCGPLNPSTLTFSKNNYKFTCYFENQWKMAAIISTSTLIPLMWVTNHFLIWHHFPIVTRQICQLFSGNTSFTETMTNLLGAWKFNQKWQQ